MMRRIGILGGMGPQATILLMQKVLASVQAVDDSDHIPLIVDQNPQVPSRIRHIIEGQGDDPGPVLAAMAKGLVAAGADALAMPCNTAHHYAGAITSAVSVPFLDMVALSVTKAAGLAGHGGTVGILASPAVRKIGLFDARFAAHGIRPIYPSDEAAMLAAIRQIKATGPGPEAQRLLLAASEELLGQNARVQMIACTEFSLIPTATARNATAFDTLDVLVAAIKDFAISGGEKTERPVRQTG
ncbi:MAG: aspartate/glutamate racemase family protein [Candidatus Saccharibacteria bacterium]|nr:aspartate/glutamate racemase family protein [Pseudorhodobacter sp.]